MQPIRSSPLVGLLYNPAVPHLLDAASELVQYLEVIPDRLWYDFGNGDPRGRFHRAHGAIETLRRCCQGRVVAGHGIGLSLPSAMPLDDFLFKEVARTHRDLNFAWYSEHMSMFLVPHGSVPNAQAGLGLPVVYCQETLDILCSKIRRITSQLRSPFLLENGAIFAAVPDMDYSEPQFFKRLNEDVGCGMLLDLHNLYVSWRNGAANPREYLTELDPNIVEEIHIAGGDELAGFYTDSHSRLTPATVWEWAHEFVPCCTHLRAITYEFHESYFARLGIDALTDELKRMHELAGAVASASL